MPHFGKRTLLLTLVAAALALALLVPAAGSRSRPCKPGAASKLRHNQDSHVFRLRKRALSPFGVSKRAGHYACNSRVGRWFALTRNGNWTVDHVYLNGDFAAYTIAAKPIEPGIGHPWRLRVMNTATGHIVKDIDFTYGSFITDFTVSRSGALAYISCSFKRGDWYFYVKRRTGRNAKTLDRGRSISEFSLTRSWQTISWVNRGRRHTSWLP